MIIQITNSDSHCGNRSFNAGLRFAGLPPISDKLDWTNLLIDKALEYGLRVDSYDGIYHTQANEPVLVTYKTQEPNTCHFVFASDIAPWAGRDVHSVVSGWEKLTGV